jgi:hypothetical protein
MKSRRAGLQPGHYGAAASSVPYAKGHGFICAETGVQQTKEQALYRWERAPEGRRRVRGIFEELND